MERETNAIEAQATAWFLRQDAEPLSTEEQQELDAWLASDPRHYGAYIQVQANWCDLDRLAAHRRTNTSPRPVPRQRSLWRWAIAASVLTVTLMGAAAALRLLHRSGEVFASSIGEVRNIALSDGSHLTLDTDTVASVNFENAQREISLERGEASFSVAHDARRPFIVRANDVVIRALGTAFTVRIDDRKTDVLVTEGLVEVVWRSASGPQVRRVGARQLATVAVREPQLEVQVIKPETIERKLAWQEGKASFAGEPLSAAIAEINRHSRVRLYVDDPTLAQAHVIGVFNADDAETFASAVAAAFGAEVTRAPDGLHLRSARSGESR
jgi:transmembrane sensor